MIQQAQGSAVGVMVIYRFGDKSPNRAAGGTPVEPAAKRLRGEDLLA
jgi:hypothetical protein